MSHCLLFNCMPKHGIESRLINKEIFNNEGEQIIFYNTTTNLHDIPNQAFKSPVTFDGAFR